LTAKVTWDTTHSCYLQAQVYKEDFISERRDREAAHGKFADLQKKYAYDVRELKAELTQMEKDLNRHRDRLAEVEQVNQRRAKEMRTLLKEASKNQQEVQAKTSQVKQYKKQVDSQRDQVCLHYLCVTSHIHVLIWHLFAPSFSFLNWKVTKKNC